MDIIEFIGRTVFNLWHPFKYVFQNVHENLEVTRDANKTRHRVHVVV